MRSKSPPVQTKFLDRHVLDYKHPIVLVAILAAIIFAVTLAVLLADPKTECEQLEGVAITESYVIDGSAPVDLPEELQAQLVVLLRQHPHGDYTALDIVEPPSSGAVVLSNITGGTTFTLTQVPGGSLSLVRINHDSYSTTRKTAVMDSSLVTSQDYALWQEKLEDYLAVGRADDLYALRTASVRDTDACADILSALGIGRVIGEYTVETNADSRPCGITLHIKSCPTTASERTWQTEYLRDTAALFIPLVEDAEQVTISYETMLYDNAVTFSAPVTANLEQFRAMYAAYRDKRTQSGFPCQVLTPTKVLYLAPGLVPDQDSQDPSQLLARFAGSKFSLSRDRLSVLLTYSSLNKTPTEKTFVKPKYTKSDCPAAITTPTGAVFDLSGYQTTYAINLYHEAFDNAFYRVYSLDQEVWFSRWDYTDLNGWTLTYLFQVDHQPF